MSRRSTYLLAAIAIGIVLSATALALAASPVRLVVNGKEVGTDVPLQIINGRIMVPLRWAAEALGLAVTWDAKSRKAEVISGAEALPDRVRGEWQYPLPRAGELTFGYLGKPAEFVLPAVASLNAYLAERQVASLKPASGSRTQKVLVRYEILSAGATYSPLLVTATSAGDMAFELVARLYYSEFPATEKAPPFVIRLLYWKGDGVSFDRPAPLRSWYEDVKFVVRPTGNAVEVVKDEAAGRTVWVQGENGWYVDEKATEVVKTVETARMADIFAPFPLPPAGYTWMLVREQ